MMPLTELPTVEETTPPGTPVILINDQGRAFFTKTRSVPWELGGHLVVMVTGKTGGYMCDRCHVLPPALQCEPESADEIPLSARELTLLEELDQSSSPAPWAYTDNCGAQVCVGKIHDQGKDKVGSFVRLEKRGIFLFEIQSDVYEDAEGNPLTEDEGEARAYRDAKLIAIMRNYLPKLLKIARRHAPLTR